MGGSKPYKFVLLAEAAVVRPVDTSKGGAKLYRLRVSNVMVASWVKLLIKIWSIEFEKSLQKITQSKNI